jgi:hypothetical protein
VLIATPNQGSPLADLCDEVARSFAVSPPQGVACLRTISEEIGPPRNQPAPEFGVIAGNRRHLLLGWFLDQENDGRVPVASTPCPGMTDFVVLPYHHKEIHHQFATANLVRNFLGSGRFGAAGENLSAPPETPTPAPEP